jgi:multidrug efflux pump subunit AcrA (membrane-fusion protein)
MNGYRKVAAGVLAAVVLAAGVGWVAGSQISSPAEEASRTAPPAAAPILVPAEERVLSTDIVTRGTARFGSPQQLSLAPSALKSGNPIAARLPFPGTELREGDVVFISSGRPVFLLAGDQPAYRDLGQGLSGSDVRQLEEALVRLGINPGPADGVYDKQTEDAVVALYNRAGYAPFVATAEQLAAVRALQTESNSSQIDVISARESIGTVEAALNAADAAHARALRAVQDSQAALIAAVGTANANDQAAAAAVNARQAALSALVAAGATPPEIAAAEADLAVARADFQASQLAGNRDVAAAQTVVAGAQADVASTLIEVRAAENAIGHADAALSVRQQQAGLVASDLALATQNAGVQLPADELIFVASTPVRVSESVARNDLTGGPLITVSNATVAIDGSLRLEEAALAEPGMRVDIDEPDLGIKASGVVSRVADAPGTNGVDGFHVYFEILVDGSPASIVGASVRLTVPVESTGGSVLAVPIGAVTLSADGSSRVQREDNGSLEFVTVEPGLSADGYVAVTAVDKNLEPGDLVVVGFDQSNTP